MSQIVTEILDTFGSPSLNLSSKLIANLDIEQMQSLYQDSPILFSIESLLSLQTTSELFLGN